MKPVTLADIAGVETGLIGESRSRLGRGLVTTEQQLHESMGIEAVAVDRGRVRLEDPVVNGLIEARPSWRNVSKTRDGHEEWELEAGNVEVHVDGFSKGPMAGDWNWKAGTIEGRYLEKKGSAKDLQKAKAAGEKAAKALGGKLEHAQLDEKKQENFKAAIARILEGLRKDGWEVKANLKVPRADKLIGRYTTSLFFKPQAVYLGMASPQVSKPDLGSSRSMHTDIRGMEVDKFLEAVGRWIKEQAERTGDSDLLEWLHENIANFKGKKFKPFTSTDNDGKPGIDPEHRKGGKKAKGKKKKEDLDAIGDLLEGKKGSSSSVGGESFRHMAIRINNAENSFLDYAMKHGKLTRKQAEKVLALYKKEKLIKIEVGVGQWKMRGGAGVFLEPDVLKRAANHKEDVEPSLTDELLEATPANWDKSPVAYSGSKEVSKKVFDQTGTGKLHKWLGTFNNVTDIKPGLITTFRGTKATAEGVARAGFTVRNLGGDRYGFKRTRKGVKVTEDTEEIAEAVDAKTEAAFKEFVRYAQGLIDTRFKKDLDFRPTLEFSKGKKWWRLFLYHKGTQGRTAYGFFDPATGDLLKAEGWKRPATNFPRGNVLDKSTWKRGGSPHHWDISIN